MSGRCAVVGGGPAGAALALCLAREGVEVVVLERSTFPRPKVCGGFVSPLGVRCLRDLGLLDAARDLGAAPIREALLCFPNVARPLRVPFESPPESPLPPYGLAVDRTRFDSLLLRAAEAAGAEVLEGCRFVRAELEAERGRWWRVGYRSRGGEAAALDADLLVGADGSGSGVARRLVGALPARPRRMGMSAELAPLPAEEGAIEMHLLPDAYCGLVSRPGGGAHLSLAFGHRADRWPRGMPLESVLRQRAQEHPHLRERVGSARIKEEPRAFGPMAFRPRRLHADGLLLVGDAAGFLDAVTGHGIGFALRSALLAAETALPALRTGDTSAGRLAGYAGAYAAELGGLLRVYRRFQRTWRLPLPLLHRLAKRLAERPEAARLLIQLGAGLAPPRDHLRLPGLLLGPP